MKLFTYRVLAAEYLCRNLDDKEDGDVSGDHKDRVRRRLAAILVAGYSRLFPGDEADRFADLTSFLTEIIEPLAPEFGGNIFKRASELVLIEFDSVVEAARCAAAMRDAAVADEPAFTERAARCDAHRDQSGRRHPEGGDVFGDGVNIAARIEALAEPGSIYVSGSSTIGVGRVELEFEDLGPKEPQEHRRPIQSTGWPASRSSSRKSRRRAPSCGEPRARLRRSAVRLRCCRSTISAAIPSRNFSPTASPKTSSRCSPAGARFPVIARNSTFTFKGQTVDVKKVGQELGARYVARRQRAQIRPPRPRHRAADSSRHRPPHHGRALRPRPDRSVRIAGRDRPTIAGAIEPELLKFERDRIAELPQHNEDAYAFYQHGMWHHYRQNKADNTKAQEYFRSALALDRAISSGDRSTGDCSVHAAYLGWTEIPSETTRKLIELAAARGHARSPLPERPFRARL